MRSPGILTALFLFGGFSSLCTGVILFASTADGRDWLILGLIVCAVTLAGWLAWRWRKGD